MYLYFLYIYFYSNSLQKNVYLMGGRLWFFTDDDIISYIFLTILGYMCLVSLYSLCSFFNFLSCMPKPFMWIYVAKKVFFILNRPKSHGSGNLSNPRVLGLTYRPDPRFFSMAWPPNPSSVSLTWLSSPSAWIMPDLGIELKKNWKREKKREDRISIEGITNS